MAKSANETDLDEILRRLQRGQGHELVHDGNVKDLIRLAVTRGDRLTETLLREWTAPCSPSNPPDPPSATT